MKVFIEAYLYGNLGDDLFLDILSERYPNTEFITVSHFYEPISEQVKVHNDRWLGKLIPLRKIQKFYAKKCDLVVSIGGSMYIEGVSEMSPVADFGKKYYIIGANFGPYDSQQYVRKHHQFFPNAEDVCFRENYSYRLFQEIKNVRKAPDIVFSCKYIPEHREHRHQLILSVINCQNELEKYRECYLSKMAQLAENFVERGYEVCCMSFCKAQKDEEAIEEIRRRCKVSIDTYYYRGNHKEALQMIADCEVVIGTRFHANVLGFLFHKAVIPIVYSKKTSNMLEDLNFQGKSISLNEIDKFEAEEITEQDLQYRLEIDKIKERAEEQFMKLDKVLN